MAAPLSLKLPPTFGLSDRFQLLWSTFVAQGFRILTTIVIARLLTPRDYGLVALASAIPGVISSLGDFGAMRCLVQIRDLPDREVRETALVISLGLSILYATTAVVCGIFLSIAYHDPRLIWITAIQGSTSILNMLYSYQMANLSRDLRFSSQSKQNLLFAGSQALTGVVLALLGFGVYALVLQALVAQLVANLMIARLVALVWPTHFNRQTFLRYWQLGWRISFSQYLNNIQGNLITLAVGFGSSPFMLGQFGRASQVRDLIGHNILDPFDRLLFSLFSGTQDNPNGMRSQFLRGCSAINLVSSLGGILLCVCGRDVIRLLLGPQWEVAGHMLQILSVSLFFTGISLPAIVLVQALGKPLIWACFSAVNLVLLAALLGAGSKLYGMDGLCVGLVITQVLISFSFFSWMVSYLAIGWMEALRPVLTVWAGALSGAAAALALKPRLAWMPLPVLTISCVLVIGTSIFFAVIWVLDRKFLVGLFKLIVHRRDATDASQTDLATS